METDRLDLQDLEKTRTVVAKMRFRSIAAALVGGLLFSAMVAALWLWRRPDEFGAAAALAGFIYLVFGLPLLVRWVLHWRRIYATLAAVEQQVLSGQPVYGSQVKF